MTNNKTENIRDLATKSMTAAVLAIVAIIVAATIACGSGETVVHTVVVEKSVPGKPVLQTVIVEKEVAVQGETVVQTVVVEKIVEVAGETVIDKGLPGAPGQAGRPAPNAAPAAEAAAASEPRVVTVVVEKEVEVVKEVVVEVEREVVVEKVVEAEAMSAAPSATPVVKTSPPRSPSQPSQPGATTFQNTTRSNFALTSQDDTSTFSLDTDRTSFQLALNWTRSWIRSRPGIGPSRRVDQRLQLRLRHAASRRLVQHSDRHHRPSSRQRPSLGPRRVPGAGCRGRSAAECDTLVLDGSGSMSRRKSRRDCALKLQKPSCRA